MEALSHVTICDLSGQLAGAGATRYLAALGARVIRVEDPVRQGDGTSSGDRTPHVDDRRGIELGGGFNNHNVEKLGVTINLRLESGRDLFRRLVAVSDVVTENFAAGVMTKLGFSYDELRAIRPDIIYVSNSGFGHDGPYATFKTFGPVVQAVCGLTFGVGCPDTPPAGWGYSYMDHMGANLMAVAILAALAHRNRTRRRASGWTCPAPRRGSGLPARTCWTTRSTGRPLRRPGMPDSNHSDQPPMAPHGIYPTAKRTAGWRSRAGTTSTGSRSVTVCGESWADELDSTRCPAGWRPRRSSTAWSRSGPRPTRRERGGRDMLLAAGVPAAPVAMSEDRIEHDPDNAAWGLFPTVHHPEIGDVRVDGMPGPLLARRTGSIERGALHCSASTTARCSAVCSA